MTLGTMVDVAIGLAFVYLMLSLLAASITELIASLMNLRGKNLAKGITAMLTGRFEMPNGDPLLQKIIDHPLIQQIHGESKRWPSYVAAQQFSTTAIDALRGGRVAGTLATEVARGVQMLDAGPARQALEAIVAEAGGDIDKLKAGLERWFDQAMDRLSGVYQRWTQARLVVIGLVTALLFNVDTFAVAKALSTNELLRANVVKAAERTAARGEESALGLGYKEAKQELASLGLPVGWPPPAIVDASKAKEQTPSVKLAARAVKTCAESWWGACVVATLCAHGSGAWLQIAFGWLLTALAVSLGAPFWFNTMTKLLNLRLAGTKPVAALGEGAKGETKS